MEFMRDIPTGISGVNVEASPAQQKRQHSRSCDYMGSGVNKRRLGSGISGAAAAAAALFLDSGGSPVRRKDAQSPSYMPTTSSSNLEAAAVENENSSVRLSDICIDPRMDSSADHNCKMRGCDLASKNQHQTFSNCIQTASAVPGAPAGNAPAYSEHSVPNNAAQTESGEARAPVNSGGLTGRNDRGNDHDNNNNNPNENTPAAGQTSSQTSQALVQKLQDIYRNIVKQEVELQERCSQLTHSQTTDLKNLWIIYKVNTELINNYVAFITTALLPSQPEQDLLIGQEIVNIYRIERRLWVHGTITFLDVLKNFSNFMDPEVCCQFITHVFISISNMLGDMPQKFATPWLERLGDLSRMAIALYPSGFIDWKLSAEHWYTQALSHIFGHGKLYYHMSTVQQNTLEAFVNLGKSVFCRDTFIPSQQYMQLVIDNIYQRAFAERNGGNQRNSLMVEYLKHSEVMLLSSFLESPELQKVVLSFFQNKFGISSNNTDYFSHQAIFLQDGERTKYFFRHAPAFAESHILQMVGFGNPKNPFALLFELPKFLKERKERKERRKSKSSNSFTSMEAPSPTSPIEYLESVDSPRFVYEFPTDLAIWQQSLSHINTTSIKCSAVVLQKFLHGPLVSAAAHLLPWAYFLLSLAIRIDELPSPELKDFWIALCRQVFPWNSIVNFLNMIIAFALDNAWKTSSIDNLCEQFDSVDVRTLVDHFSQNEDLPEVWKCWGALWFDVISDKSDVVDEGATYNSVQDHMFGDMPVDGICFDEDDETGSRFWKRACRLVFIFKGIAQEFNMGLTLASVPLQSRRSLAAGHPLQNFCFKFEDPPVDSESYALISTQMPAFENISERNLDPNAPPGQSMLEGKSLFELPGYRQLHADHTCFNKTGTLITCSLYTSGSLEKGPIHGGDDFNTERYSRSDELNKADNPQIKELDKMERMWLDTCMNPEFIEQTYDMKFPFGDLSCNCDSGVSYFVPDATSWLRHFAHVYKLATNGVLRFAICLTTFQELRFLRKSKDESVVEAATRAVITVRQLYSEKRLLPLRFTGNVATHLEEHLEFEEQITWRSHVDEFVIEAVYKAQNKFEALNAQAKEGGHDFIPTTEEEPFHFIALVSDDTNMRLKAHAQRIRTFSSRFMFAVCNQIGLAHHACTN
ncbi:PIN domain-containing protein [Lachancea thermotolerans CBS 6340]|uniref:KLTH0E00968p n=1 Tax=Lachancea thermotolerans (strain ATCC 56472 / CBS 6340 / NRRL Y-8284) TaxID=559295 RepID=C5DH32_LACTC|nr:KLTH0E00968p [Lachancea thermotolerans CBS 6340]CAR23093.1 KLTH0E00968p [Lachancea thermotolerans CBS 6340]